MFATVLTLGFLLLAYLIYGTAVANHRLAVTEAQGHQDRLAANRALAQSIQNATDVAYADSAQVACAVVAAIPPTVDPAVALLESAFMLKYHCAPYDPSSPLVIATPSTGTPSRPAILSPPSSTSHPTSNPSLLANGAPPGTPQSTPSLILLAGSGGSTATNPVQTPIAPIPPQPPALIPLVLCTVLGILGLCSTP